MSGGRGMHEQAAQRFACVRTSISVMAWSVMQQMPQPTKHVKHPTCSRHSHHHRHRYPQVHTPARPASTLRLVPPLGLTMRNSGMKMMKTV